MRRAFILMPVLVLLIAGCYVDREEPKKADVGDRYQMIQAQDGQIYRLDRETGSLSMVRNGVMVPVEQMQEQISGGEYETELERPRFLGEKQMPGEQLKCAVKTSWQEGKMYFSMKVYPYESVKKLYEKRVAHYARIVIHLKDKDGFTVLEIPVKLTDMTEIKDREGNIEYLSLSSGGPFSAQMYQDIDDYYVVWKLKSDLVPDAPREREEEKGSGPGGEEEGAGKAETAKP